MNQDRRKLERETILMLLSDIDKLQKKRRQAVFCSMLLFILFEITFGILMAVLIAPYIQS